MSGDRAVLLIGGLLALGLVYLVEPRWEVPVFCVACTFVVCDMMLAILGPLWQRRARMATIAEEDSKMVTQVPIPDSVKERAKAVKRRVGHQGGRDMRRLLDQQRAALPRKVDE